MKIGLVALLCASVMVAVGGSMVATPGQSQRPGELSPPNVWVQNRGAEEAIPVQLVDAGQPLRVQLARTSSGAIEPIPVAASRQQWEYAQVRIAANQNAVAELNTAGAEGWETTGAILPSPGGTLVLLKRPR